MVNPSVLGQELFLALHQLLTGEPVRQESGLALGLELGHVRVVLTGAGHDLDVEEHGRSGRRRRVRHICPEGALLGRRHRKVDPPRNHVHLLQELRDPEGVDDVTRGQVELHALTDGQVERGDGLLGARLTGEDGLRAGLVDLLIDVVEVPTPLLAHDVDVHVRLDRGVEQVGLVLGGCSRRRWRS